MTNAITSEKDWFNIDYLEENAYYKHFVPLLENKAVSDYCEKQLFRSLSHIGLSQLLQESLLCNLANLNFNTFHEKFDEDIKDVYLKTYGQLTTAKYFSENIIPSIPPSKLVLDIGCGTGILVEQLAKSNQFERIMGCEWNSCPEWKDIMKQNENKIQFHVVKDDSFGSFIKTNKPDAFVLTWVLHHMELSTQHTYIKNLFDMMCPGTRLVILEDCYSTDLPPEIGEDEHEKFMKFSHQERQDILTIYDWVTNIFLERRAMPIPSTYRTLEEWQNFFSNIGFNIISKRFIGWPIRDVINPQGLLVVEKSNIN